jgi:hypothetical protein
MCVLYNYRGTEGGELNELLEPEINIIMMIDDLKLRLIKMNNFIFDFLHPVSVSIMVVTTTTTTTTPTTTTMVST